MSMKVRPDYINPLTMLDRKGTQRPGQPGGKGKASASELQTKRQQLQNQLLLLKAAGTDAGADPDAQEALAQELEQVSTQLRTARAESVQAAEQGDELHLAGARRSRDWYEPERVQTASPGIYQVEPDEEQGWRISFPPYSE